MRFDCINYFLFLNKQNVLRCIELLIFVAQASRTTLFEISSVLDLGVGESVGQVTAYDGDISAPNNVVNFEILDSGNDTFGITSSGVINLKRTLDFETEVELTLEILAYDSGDIPLSVSTTVTVSVQDVNDNKPVFTRDAYFFDIREDLSSFELIGTVLATDEDSGVNAELVYSLKSADAVVLSVFGVDSLSGVIYATRYN